MKLKFNITNGILLLSQSMLMLAFTSCGGNNKKLVGALSVACEEVDLDVNKHAIDPSVYFKESASFTDSTGYMHNGVVVDFEDIQFDTVYYKSIYDMLDTARKSIADYKCKIVGLKIFYALDTANKCVKPYYVPNYTNMPTKIGTSNDYTFGFDNDKQNLAEYINNSIPVYEAINLNLVNIKDSTDRKNLALKYYADYINLIRFERTAANPNGRAFVVERDATSIFFPDEEIIVLEKSAVKQTVIYIASGCKSIDGSSRHTLNLGNMRPPASAGKTNLERSLKRNFKKNEYMTFNKSTVLKKEIDEVTPDELQTYRGMSGNLGQLCPSKCKELSTVRDPVTKRFSIK